MGTNCSHLPLTKEEQNEARSRNYLENCIIVLQNLKKENKKHNVDDTIEYIKRKDVQKQFAGIINLFPKNNPMIMCINNDVGLTVMEIILKNSKGEEYCVNFWPCADSRLSVKKEIS